MLGSLDLDICWA